MCSALRQSWRREALEAERVAYLEGEGLSPQLRGRLQWVGGRLQELDSRLDALELRGVEGGS